MVAHKRLTCHNRVTPIKIKEFPKTPFFRSPWKSLNGIFKSFEIQVKFHFVDGENLIQKPWEEFAEIEIFLDIQPIVGINFCDKNLIFSRFLKIFNLTKKKGSTAL